MGTGSPTLSRGALLPSDRLPGGLEYTLLWVPSPQQILVNQTIHRNRGDPDMGPPARYLDRADLTIPLQVDPRLGDNQT